MTNTNPGKNVKLALDVIKANGLVFLKEVAVYMNISEPTFANYGLNKNEEILNALEKNKVEKKKYLRDKWYDSENATLQVALYKLIGDKEEVHRLANTRQEIKHEVVDHSKIIEEIESYREDEE